MRRVSILLAMVGLALGIALINWSGLGDVSRAVGSVGWGGYGLTVAWQALLFLTLGIAWDTLGQIGGRRPAWVWVWGRMVRESAATLLPLAQMGGFVAGARAVNLCGVGGSFAAASTIVDVTAEVMAQAAFAVAALCILAAYKPDSGFIVPLAIGIAAVVVGVGGFVLAQRGAARIFRWLGARIARRRAAGVVSHVDQVQTQLAVIYAHPGRLALGTALHMAGWLGTGMAAFITFRLLGAHITVLEAIAIEGLLAAILAAAFLVPGNLGVQEAAYAGLGVVFGISPDVALAASLIRRARDLTFGVPTLLAWQVAEAQRLRRSPARQ
ncbi:MAG: flippase-like domain-containing protein [Candidatus Eremiobacteraeota bacterium]|nr:flippase-like domain-containing protein [Candidatus Eremiobacteraeota bacterium]